MNIDEIIKMAREAGFNGPVTADGYMGLAYDRREGGETGGSLERFFHAAYTAGAAAERERIRKAIKAAGYPWRRGPDV